MSKIQPMPRKSFSKSAALGRRLNAASLANGPDQSIKDATCYEPELNKLIQRCTATEGFVKGKAVVLNGEKFYLVRPNENPYLSHYFYIVTYRTGEYQCSMNDENIARQCINRVKAYRGDRSATQVITEAPIAHKEYRIRVLKNKYNVSIEFRPQEQQVDGTWKDVTQYNWFCNRSELVCCTTEVAAREWLKREYRISQVVEMVEEAA